MLIYPRRPVTLVIRPVDQACNLECEYCNEWATLSTPRVMTAELLEELVAQASNLEYHQVQFCWHGGEPLLAGLAFYRLATRLQEQYFRARSSGCYENVVQTNGLLLDDEYLEFFKASAFAIGISVDGPDASANRYRFPDRRAAKLLSRTIDACFAIKKHGLRLVVIAVVHDGNVDRPAELFDFFFELGVDNLSFNPRYRRQDHLDQNLDPTKYERFLEEIRVLRDRAVMEGRRKMGLGLIDRVLRPDGNRPNVCFLSNKCNHFLSISREGRIYATCTDELGIEIGELESSGLCDAMSRMSGATRLNSLLSDMGDSIEHLGPGCPKYSNGSRDLYLPVYARMAQSRE